MVAETSARGALDGYITELSIISTELEKIQSTADAQNASGVLSQARERLDDHADRLMNLATTERTALLAEKADELAAAVQRFQEQRDRVLKDESRRASLSNLEQVQLIRP